MMRLLISLFVSATFAFAGGGTVKPVTSACSVVPLGAIQKVFGERVTNAKPSSQISNGVVQSQCFYTLPTFTNSVSVSVVTASRENKDGDAVRELWRRSFHDESNDADRDAGRISEEREAGAKASPLENLGDEAFWVHSFVGNLYVLTGNTFLRISIGGKLTDQERQERAKALAAAALANLRRRR